MEFSGFATSKTNRGAAHSRSVGWELDLICNINFV
jgi:hypothetical protein